MGTQLDPPKKRIERSTASPTFWPMSVVAKRSSISSTAKLLLEIDITGTVSSGITVVTAALALPNGSVNDLSYRGYDYELLVCRLPA